MIYFSFNLSMIIPADVFASSLYIVPAGLTDFVNDLNTLVGEPLRPKLEGSTSISCILVCSYL